MKKHYFRNTILISSFIFFLAIVFSCGTYQGSSYYTSDGIYGGTSISENETNDLNNSSFYKDVFNNIADDYSSTNDFQNYVFTDIDNYHSSDQNVDASLNSQMPWGDKVDNTQIYYTNNLPMHYYYDYYYPYYNYGYGYMTSYSPLWRRYRYYDYYLTHRYYGGHSWGLGYYGGYPYHNYWPYYGGYYGMSYHPYNRWSIYYQSPYYYSSFERKYREYESISFANTSRGGRTSATKSRSKEVKEDINKRSEISATINALKTRYNIGRNPSYVESSVNNKVDEGERNLIRSSRTRSYVPASQRSNLNYKEGYRSSNSRGVRITPRNNTPTGINSSRSSLNRTSISPSRSSSSGTRSYSSSSSQSRGSSGSTSSRGGRKK